MRKLVTVGLATLMTAGTIAIGAGVAHADSGVCAGVTGAEGCWDATSHHIDACDTAQDGNTAYTYYEDDAGNWHSVHTTLGFGSCAVTTLGPTDDIGGFVHFYVANVNSSGMIVLRTPVETAQW
jgi:hypothetical protein